MGSNSPLSGRENVNPLPAITAMGPPLGGGLQVSRRADSPLRGLDQNVSPNLHGTSEGSFTQISRPDTPRHGPRIRAANREPDADADPLPSRICVFKEADAGIDVMYKMGGSISVNSTGKRYKEPKAEADKEQKVDSDRAVPITVNYFPVIIEEKPTFIHHYVMELEPSCNYKPMNRLLKYLMQRHYFDGDLIGYDGQNNMYIAESTLRKKDYLDRKEIEFTIIPYPGADSYEMKLKRVNVLGDIGLRSFLMGGVAKNPLYYRRALEVIMREGPNSSRSCYTVNNASYYWDGPDQSEGLHIKKEGKPLGTGGHSIGVLKGFVQSLRAVDRGLTFNLDSTSMAFHRRIKLTQYLEGRGICTSTLKPSGNTSVDNHLRKRAEDMLKDLYVDVLHRATFRKYKIAGISHQPASTCELPDGITVANYFRQNYEAIKVNETLYCVMVRGDPYTGKEVENNSENRERPLPIEDCVIADEQTCPQAYSRMKKNTGTLRKLAGGDPSNRYDMIRKSFTILGKLCGDGQENHNETFSSLKLFGIDIGKEMISINGRLIPEPNLWSNAERFTGNEPNRGKWMLKKVHSSGRSLKPDNWDVIVFSRNKLEPKEVKTMIDKLLKSCSELLMNSFEAQTIEAQTKDLSDLWINTSDLKEPSHVETLEKALKSLKKKYFDRLRRVSFVFCIFQKKESKFFYEAVKRLCDTEMGWITQCCRMAYLNLEEVGQKRKGYPSAKAYRRNVALKLNAKLGGVNTVLDEKELLDNLFGKDSKVILFGTDVIHPLKNQNINDHQPNESQNQNMNDDPDIEMQNADAAPAINSQTEKQTEKSSQPNLAVMVASMHWPNLTQYRARVTHLPLKATQGKILDQLSVMAKELLDAHAEANGKDKLPTRAIFFRDAVSDGEFQSLRAEFHQLRQTLKAELPEIKTTMIVVRRNDNTRFFTKIIDKEGKEVMQNPEAGTVVDSEITRPRPTSDFYLVSQSIQEKTLELPTHYFVLHDEIRLSRKLKELENFMYYLCHTCATSTRSVAVVPPLLYAHQVAARATASYVAGKDCAQHKLYPHPDLIDTMYFC